MLLQFLLILPSLLSQGMHSYCTNSHLQVLVLSSPFSSPQSPLSCPFFCLAPTGEHIPPPHVTTFLQAVSELLTRTNSHSHSFRQSSANILWRSGKNLFFILNMLKDFEIFKSKLCDFKSHIVWNNSLHFFIYKAERGSWDNPSKKGKKLELFSYSETCAHLLFDWKLTLDVWPKIVRKNLNK